MKPLLRDALLLVGLELGISALMAGILAVLPFGSGSGSWVGVVGGMVGAQTFVMLREKRQPGGLDPKTFHRLALAATLGQVIAGALVFALLRLVAPPPSDEEGGFLALPASWLAGTAVVGALVAYVATRLGLRMGLKNSRRRPAPPKAP
jgi:hypothetical protein